MNKEEIIKGLKIATRKIGGCSDVGGWLSDDESKAIMTCEQVIKGLEDGTIILLKEDKCTRAENNQFVEMIEKDAFERNIHFKDAFCNRNRELIIKEITQIKAEIQERSWYHEHFESRLVEICETDKIIDKYIAELKGDSEKT